MYLYIYLLKSLYLLEFIVVSILSNWNVFIQFVFLLYLLEMYLSSFISVLYPYIYSYLLGWIYFSFLNTCAIKFIEGKFYFEGRVCYIGKIMPTCIE